MALNIQDKVTSFTAGDIFSNILQSRIWGKILFWAELILVVGLLAVGVAYIYKRYLPFRIKVNIYKRIGYGAYEIVKDKAKITVDSQGKHKLELMRIKKGKRKLTLPIPSQDFRIKQGRADTYNLFMDDNSELHPILIPEMAVSDQGKLRIMPQEREAWARNEEKMLLEKTQNKPAWEKWMPQMIFLAVLFAGVLICFFLFKNIGAGMSELADTFRQIASSCASLR